MATASSAILYFTNSPFMGGMEAHIQHLAVGFARRQRRVGLICPPGGAVAPLREACAAAGVEVFLLPAPNSPASIAGRLRDLLRTMRGYRGGLLHMHLTGPYGGELVMLAARLSGLRAIVRTEHQPLASLPSRFQLARMRLRDHFLDRVICVSESTRDYFAREVGRDDKRLVSIPNCLDLERFRPGCVDGMALRNELGIARDALVVGTVSRLSEERKGGGQFLAMAGRLTCLEGVHFLIVGDGDLRPGLEAMAREAGIAEIITFAGSRDDVPNVLAALDVFVMASLWEGGPITVLEAMAMAKPVVATRVGMVSEAIADGVNGLVVPPGDVDALSHAVLSLALDARMRASLGEAARKTAVERYSRETMLQRTASLYEEALANHYRRPAKKAERLG